jgi:hypothetical protein
MESDTGQRTYGELHAESGGERQLSYSYGQRLERRAMPGDIGTIREDGKQQLERQSKQSGENYWSVEPAMGRLAHGLPNRVDRLKGLGNAIVPQIAELLFSRIKYILESEPRTASKEGRFS